MFYGRKRCKRSWSCRVIRNEPPMAKKEKPNGGTRSRRRKSGEIVESPQMQFLSQQFDLNLNLNKVKHNTESCLVTITLFNFSSNKLRNKRNYFYFAAIRNFFRKMQYCRAIVEINKTNATYAINRYMELIIWKTLIWNPVTILCFQLSNLFYFLLLVG